MVVKCVYVSVPRAVASVLHAPVTLATARGTDPASLPVHAIANRSKLPLIARRRGHRRRRLLQILVVPCQISLEPVADVTRAADAVILVGINHELRLDAETAERLVHLLASGQRHVEIDRKSV